MHFIVSKLYGSKSKTESLRWREHQRATRGDPLGSLGIREPERKRNRAGSLGVPPPPLVAVSVSPPQPGFPCSSASALGALWRRLLAPHSCVFSERRRAERSRAERRRGRWSREAEPPEWLLNSGGICTPSAAMSGRSWILPTSWATWLPGLGTVSGCRLPLGARKQFRTYFLFPFHPHAGLSINRVNAGFVARSSQYFRLGIVKSLRSPWRPTWGNWVPAKWNDLLRAAYLFKLKSWGNMSLSVSFISANSYVRLLCWSLGWHQRFRIRYKPFLKIL